MQRLLIALLLVLCLYSSAQEQTSEDIIKKGVELFDEDKLDEALKMYKLVQENDSNYNYMLTEMALCYLQMEKYDSAIIIANKALAEPSRFRQHLLKTKGTSYDYSGQPDKAIEIYNEAIKSYPYSYQLHYNLGITYLNQKNYSKAQECFKDALLCNVYHSSSHMYLGVLMARQGLITKAILSLETFLALEPSSKRSNSILVYLENLVSGVRDTSMGQFIEPITENSIFEDVDNLINSKVALSSRYKSAIDFDASIVRQTQLLFESLPYNSESNDFWVQLYFPFFKEIKDEEHIEPFLFTILRSSGRESVVKYQKKNEKTLKEFYNTGSKLSTVAKSRSINIDGKDYTLDCSKYDNGSLYSLGNLNSEGKQEGIYIYYYSNGELMSTGKFVNGEKEGEWKYYYDNGLLKVVEHYKKGVLEGEFKKFHETEKLSLVANYVNNNVSGEVRWFDLYGVNQQVTNFKSSKRDGSGKIFYPTGIVKEEFNYIDDNLDGYYNSYHPNGQLASKYFYKNSVLEGEFSEYFINGMLSVKGAYSAGEENGIWEYFYSNGNLKKTITFSNGKVSGEIKEYHYNGIIESVSSVNSEGNYHGLISYFNYKGEKILEEKYDNGIIIRVASIDKSGKEYSVYENSKGSFSFVTYFSPGIKRTSGEFNKGVRVGVWTNYYRNGNPNQVFNYTDGEIDGEYKYFHPNGALKEVYNYVKGTLQGNYTGYSPSGIVIAKGYYKDGEQDNLWRNFLENGALEYTSYLIKGKLNGFVTYYAVDGKVRMRNKFQDNSLLVQEEFDDKGERTNYINFLETTKYTSKSTSSIILSEASIVGGKYNGVFKWFHPNGKESTVYTFLNGNKEGEFIRYSEDGKILTKGYYLNDTKDGKWVNFYESGKVSYVEKYFNNMNDSIHTAYYENGNVSVVESYFEDEYNGDVIHYDINGDLMVKLIHCDGELIGYQYNKSTGLSDTILITNGGQPILAYYADGTPSFEQQFKNFLPDGFQKRYYRNGSIRQIREFKDGKLHGNYIEYYANGNPKLKYSCEYGLYQGDYIEYWENGSIKTIIPYLHDERNGECKHFDINGKLIKVENYWNGSFTGYKK